MIYNFVPQTQTHTRIRFIFYISDYDALSHRALRMSISCYYAIKDIPKTLDLLGLRNNVPRKEIHDQILMFFTFFFFCCPSSFDSYTFLTTASHQRP